MPSATAKTGQAMEYESSLFARWFPTSVPAAQERVTLAPVLVSTTVVPVEFWPRAVTGKSPRLWGYNRKKYG